MTDTDVAFLPKTVERPTRLPLVVCIDDEPQVLGALSRLLRREPYEFRTTSDPDEALEWIRTLDVALLVVDYRMPGMSGTTILQIAKATSPRTARMMLTGYPGETLVIAAGEAGLMHLVGKPWDDGALKSKIRNLVADWRTLEGDDLES